MDMQRLLRASVQFKASDLHVQVGSPPTVRVDGTLVAFNAPPVTAEEVHGLIAEVTGRPWSERNQRHRESDRENRGEPSHSTEEWQ